MTEKYNKRASTTPSMNDADTNMAALDSLLELARDIVGRTQFAVAYCTPEIATKALEAAREISALRVLCEKHRYELRMQMVDADTTKNRERLYADALAQGYAVSTEADGTVLIVRRGKPTKRHVLGKVLAGIAIYENGTAIRLDVDASVAIGMRSFADMRRALGLK